MTTSVTNKGSFYSLPQELRDKVYEYYLEDKVMPARVFSLRIPKRLQIETTSDSNDVQSGSARSETSWLWRRAARAISNTGSQHNNALMHTRRSIAHEYVQLLQKRCALQIEIDDVCLDSSTPFWAAWNAFSSQGMPQLFDWEHMTDGVETEFPRRAEHVKIIINFPSFLHGMWRPRLDITTAKQNVLMAFVRSFPEVKFLEIELQNHQVSRQPRHNPRYLQNAAGLLEPALASRQALQNLQILSVKPLMVSQWKRWSEEQGRFITRSSDGSDTAYNAYMKPLEIAMHMSQAKAIRLRNIRERAIAAKE